jgi:phosphatidylglycerol lysyltransferase
MDKAQSEQALRDSETAGTLASWLGSSRLRAALVVVLFALVAIALFHEVEITSWHEVRLALGAVLPQQILLAVLGTIVSYGALIGYDVLALRHVEAKPVAFGRIALTSFISQAFTFNFGFGILTGTAVRMRLYGAAGLKPDQILATSVFATFAVWLGILSVAGLAVFVSPEVTENFMSVPANVVRGIGLLVLALVGWGCWFISTRRPVLPGLDMRAPEARVTGLALLVGAADVVASGFALWALLPAEVTLSFPGFLVIFASAIALGMISHVPGGLGVFEGVILIALPNASSSALLASLLLFRFIYYIAPMLIAAAALVVAELFERRDAIALHAQRIGAPIGASIPVIAAVLTFVGGFILMVSGALPAEHQRMAILRYTVPLPFVEASHLVASAIGTMLLITSYGLARRLESAWWVAMSLLVLGAAFSLLKGIDYEEAAVCCAIALLLLAGRRWFYRKGGALSGSVQGSEILVIGLAIVTSIWIGFIAFRDVAYDSSLWWEFTYHGDAPRFLRATVAVAITLLVAVTYRLIHSPMSSAVPVAPADLEKVRAIVASSDTTQANLALIGDKQFLFNAEGTGFVMYGTQGSSWIAMGDPVVSCDEDAAGLIWQFKELVDRHAGVPAFYEISAQNLPLYLDSGFSMVKLGEEACVELDKFSLETAENRKLRQAMSKAQRAGMTFEVVPAHNVNGVLPELRRVSEQWLAERGQKEKGFSLGYWDDAYMLMHDAAIVRMNGQVVAFANLWRAANRNESSIDIMRVLPDAPNGTMDFLFTSLLQYFKGEGYRWFNLGMAPLSGLSPHRLAPLWTRLARWVSRHGDRFYKFEGLRAFKNKFKPEWRSHYLAYPGGVSLPQILIDVTALIASSPARARKEREA